MQAQPARDVFLLSAPEETALVYPSIALVVLIAGD